MKRILLTLSLALVAPLAPARADIPVPREEKQRYLQDDLDKQLKGLSAEQQRLKVEQLLAEMPKKKTEMDKRVREAEEQERAGHRQIPAYMLAKQRRGLDEQEQFLRDWLSAHPAKGHSSDISPPISDAGGSPAIPVGAIFLSIGLALAGRRILGPTPASA